MHLREVWCYNYPYFKGKETEKYSLAQGLTVSNRSWISTAFLIQSLRFFTLVIVTCYGLIIKLTIYTEEVICRLHVWFRKHFQEKQR